MSKPTKIRNSDARKFTEARREFDGNNLFARWIPGNGAEGIYVVWSYGTHWPLFVWVRDPVSALGLGVWYENTDRYSVTTSKHKTLSHPCPVSTEKLGAVELRRLIESLGRAAA